jgi:CRP/FNR family transcriptional regulator, cyclic AMP receptor protein
MSAMFPLTSIPSTPGLKGLVEAIAQNTAEESLGKTMTPQHWAALAPFLLPFSLAQNQMLIAQGSVDRTLYFLESGSLSVHYEDESGRVHLAILNAGSVVGEAGFFADMPRNATVQAASDCKLWNLTHSRFADLSLKVPRVALALSLALGAIVSKRMMDRRKRISVT